MRWRYESRESLGDGEEFAGKATGNDGRGSHTFAIVEFKAFQGFSTLSRGKKLKPIFQG